MTRKHSRISDRIDKRVELEAPIAAVWKALADAEQFGTWFHLKLQDPFRVGMTSRGRITYEGLERVQLELLVQEMRPQRLFSYTWHPYAIDPRRDYSGEPPTLVEFRLEPAGRRTRLSISESGFMGLPHTRSSEAFRMHSQGWTTQIKNLKEFLAGKVPA